MGYITGPGHSIVIVKFHLGYFLTAHGDISAVHSHIIPNGEGKHQSRHKHHYNDADYIAPLFLGFGLFLLFLISLHLAVILGHDL